jgi:dienelactone hydrolase
VAEVVLFHHVRGLTAGCVALADVFRAAGHVVHTPDLFDGKTFPALDEGLAYAEEVGFGTIVERGVRASEELPNEIVYAGLSLGVMPAQMLAQTRPGAKGALLLHAAAPISEFGERWPHDVPLQIHTMEDDEYGDVDVAREIGDTVAEAEVFVYPGDRHLFSDNSLADYDEQAASLLKERALGFLAKIE